MSVSLFNIYVQSCKDLARSIIIKSEATARAINEYDKYFYPDFFKEHDRKTWRYYMHLAGKYHPSDLINGKPSIKILSIDTVEEIDFTVENLRYHRATWREYQKGSTYYQNLINKYPEQVKLIDGILNPINIEEAIDAEDNTILWYDKRFVEENEYTLMNQIQNYILMFYQRWDNNDYEITSDLYVASRIGILYIYLPYFIMQARYERSRTIEAHSFHIWSYLGSHQYLDEYKSHLNLFQRMWFYRNIRWVENLPGKTHTFKKLIDVIMTERRLPIAQFQTRQDIAGMIADNQNFYPDINFKREPLNLKDEVTRVGNTRTVEEIVDKQIDEARDNKHFLKEDKINADNNLSESPESSLSSKVLESLVIDSSKRQAIRPEDVELNEWIYMVTQDLYVAKINVTHPKTANQLSLSQREALIVFIYALLKSKLVYSGENNKDVQMDPKLIPTIIARNVLRRRKPTIKEISKVVDFTYCNPIYLHAADHYAPVVEKIISVDEFSEFTDRVIKAKNIHRNLYSFTEKAREHINVKVATEQYYETVICKLTDKEMSFKDYFRFNSIEVEGMSPNEYAQLANELLITCLGQDIVKRNSLREIQAMMVRLLKQLSSYSIQILKTINEENTIVFDWPYLRYQPRGTYVRDLSYPQMTMLDFRYAKCKTFHKNTVPLFPKPLNFDKLKSRSYGSSSFADLILDFKELITIKSRESFRMPSVQLKFVREVKRNIDIPKDFINPWDMDQFKIHKTTENRSRIEVDKETGDLIARGVVYVKDDYNGKE